MNSFFTTYILFGVSSLKNATNTDFFHDVLLFILRPFKCDFSFAVSIINV